MCRFIPELGQQFWCHLTMLESGTSEQRTLTRGISAKKHMSELWIQRRLTKLSCHCQKMPCFVVLSAVCRSINRSLLLLFILFSKISRVFDVLFCWLYLFLLVRPQDISSFAASIMGDKSKLFLTLLMIACAAMCIFRWLFLWDNFLKRLVWVLRCVIVEFSVILTCILKSSFRVCCLIYWDHHSF